MTDEKKDKSSFQKIQEALKNNVNKDDPWGILEDLESGLREDIIIQNKCEIDGLIGESVKTTRWGRELIREQNQQKKEDKKQREFDIIEAKKEAKKAIKEEKDILNNIKAQIKGKSKKMDTRIRGLDRLTWELFKQYCREESVSRNKDISANTMLLEMIDMVVTLNTK